MTSSGVSTEALEHYLGRSARRRPAPPGAFIGAAGGAPCGDLVRIALSADHGRIAEVSFDAEGCAVARAAAAAVAELSEGRSILDAAKLGAPDVAHELGGLSPAASHAAELAADALHRAISSLLAGEDLLVPPGLARGANGHPRTAVSEERVAAASKPGANPNGAAPGTPRVLVALSGGVDSAVAAVLEQRGGAGVVAVTLKLWADQHNDGERSCCSPEAVLRARALAHSMSIPHLTMDLTTEFRAGVVEPFLGGHRQGNTPNPCVLCNGEVRIDAMARLAERLGAAGLATGHYAQISDDGEGPLLTAPADESKDQTYMLSGISPQTLRWLRFPLAKLTKPQVRDLAEAAGLPVAKRPESQDLCFLAGEGKRAFLERHGGLAEREGDIVDTAGRRIGVHPGHHNFTVGQRRGLGVAAGEPLYVLGTDAGRNRVVVGSRSRLRTRSVRVRDAVLHRDGARVNRVRLRYHARPLECRVASAGGRAAAGVHERLALELAEPADSAAPGQTAALMDGESIVGHGTIA